MNGPHKLTIAADTTLGVLFTDATIRRGGLLITDKLIEAVAQAHDLPVEEITELVLVVKDGKVLPLPPPPHHSAHKAKVPA